MKLLSIFLAIFVIFLENSCNDMKQNVLNSDEMMIRMSEIGVDSVYLNEYLRILKEESEASVRLEPGVISIYPMFQKENPTEIRILEIYANKQAYESHLQTPHFKTYKTSTLNMVKSLKLIDMEPIDKNSMPNIFKKLDQTEIPKK
jgi:quinol monooxygenase YgiN